MTLFGDAELYSFGVHLLGEEASILIYLIRVGRIDGGILFCEKLNEGRQAAVVAPMIDSVASVKRCNG